MAPSFLVQVTEIENVFGEIRLEREADICLALDTCVRGLLDIQVKIVTRVAVDTYFKFTG